MSLYFQDLEEQLDQKNRLIKRLQSQIKSFEASLKGEAAKRGMQKLKKKKNSFYSLKNSLFVFAAKRTSTPIIPKDYLGMLEYKREDEPRLIQNIILGNCISSTRGTAMCFMCLVEPLTSSFTDLKPKGVVVNMIPGLPAFLLFMCVRHADYLNDDERLKSLMNGVISGIKQVIVVSLGLAVPFTARRKRSRVT